jgi:hypothetical protein
MKNIYLKPPFRQYLLQSFAQITDIDSSYGGVIYIIRDMIKESNGQGKI